ncbi:Panacea domain-containing protein [Lactococcus lactis]|uniref:Panacea domain-containing protein n=1 Tax=Lactococcus lactis TaxID=1358 RepID=UPI000E4FC300|nr:type II toxin-antitoxin system antitoxin SocA domain-containing protein [Lactococcus lactis]RHJ28942.1 DUF4065 domain-containing protein [Lactococcus lactis]
MSNFNVQEPISVANFIIDYAQKTGRSVSNLQLQKIMYFIQGAFLNEYNKELLNSSFSRWQYGPVLKEVYAIFRDNGSLPIEKLAITAQIKNGVFELGEPQKTTSENLGDGSVFKYLQEVTSKLLEIAPWELVEISHNQDIWYDHKDEILNHMAPDYKNEEIKNACKDNINLWQKQ